MLRLNQPHERPSGAPESDAAPTPRSARDGIGPEGGRATSPAHAEQRVITSLLMARVDELRRSRGMSVERLAHASDLSLWTLQKARRDLSDPRLTTILRLCRGLGVAAGELLDELPLPVETRPRRSPRSPQAQGER